jgi:hypothetical protein
MATKKEHLREFFRMLPEYIMIAITLIANLLGL